jgi:hypothetical protein
MIPNIKKEKLMDYPNIKDCEGCAATRLTSGCPWFSETLICPCSICLIKVMCKVGCDLFWKHATEIRRLKEIKGNNNV